MASIIKDIKYQYAKGDVIIRLIMVNIALFTGIGFIYMLYFLMGGNWNALNSFMAEWLYVPAQPLKLLVRPWTLISYMFLHADLMHILFNMLMLWWFGKILRDFMPDKKILSVYLLGGLAGALLFVITFNIFPPFLQKGVYPMVGSSASIMAIVLAAATLNPKGQIRLFIIGSIELQYLALFIVLIDILQIPYVNPGGHIAHLGGAFMGWLFIYQMRKGKDLSLPIENIINWLQLKKASKKRKKREPRMAYKKAHQTTDNSAHGSAVGNYDYSDNFSQKYRNMTKQECVDAILDKIQQKGYNSLTDDEKSFLDRSSKD